ncbi:MAG: membrane protein insertase YidC, partial [Rhizomicrobium sp.]
MNANRNNMFLAIALSAMVIFAWQYFVVTPQMKADQARQATLAKQEKKQSTPAAPGAAPGSVPGMPTAAATHMSREAALKVGGARVAIDSPLLDGSIALKGAKLDDLRLKKYHETTDPKSPEIVLLAP